MTFSPIYPHLHRLSSLEIEIIDKLAQSIINETAHLDSHEIYSNINNKNYSLSYKTIYLSLVQLSRRFFKSAKNSDERTKLIRDIKKLMTHLDDIRIKKINKNIEREDSNKPDNTKKSNDNLREGIRIVYSLSVGRIPVEEEINIWLRNFQEGVSFDEFLLGMISSEEAKANNKTAKNELLLSLTDGEFVQTVYEILLGRCAKAWEIDELREQLENNYLTRSEVLSAVFVSSHQIQNELANSVPHDGLSCLVMGTGTHVSAKDWEFKAKTLPKEVKGIKNTAISKYAYNFSIKTKSQTLVSAIASLYRGGDFIEQFMDNITGQHGFTECCELIIVDADSPENECETIKRFLSKFKNINYIHCNYRIGIYEAWNLAAKSAQGKYLTNTNLDDLRRYDSLMLQAEILETLNFVDVVYQDLFYTFDPTLSFDDIAKFGLQTTLPVISSHNMLDFNSPHNAPMWRKQLHNELGYFETRYRSAGDYDFWLRCLAAGKKFYKINEPHVVYYQNPKGLSTRPDTRGLAESCEILKNYGRKLISKDVVMPRRKFIENLSAANGCTISDVGDRYDLVQQSLRNLARTQKYPKI